MKGIKKFSALGAVAFSFLLGAAAAQATTVILDGNNVVGIEDLLVTDQFGTVTNYDVEFLVTTAADLYGSALEPQLQDENAMLGRIAVVDALNNNIPLPSGAGPNGTAQFFIGAFREEATMVAVGGQYFGGLDATWFWCDTDCLPFGVKVMLPDQTATYASFAESVGPPVPLPPAVWLFGSALLGIVGVARRKKSV